MGQQRALDLVSDELQPRRRPSVYCGRVSRFDEAVPPTALSNRPRIW